MVMCDIDKYYDYKEGKYMRNVLLFHIQFPIVCAPTRHAILYPAKSLLFVQSNVQQQSF